MFHFSHPALIAHLPTDVGSQRVWCQKRDDSQMKKFAGTLALVLIVTGGAFAYRTIDACGDWQERYKRFFYVEMMKNSPMIYTPEMIEEIAGGRPFACDRPSTTLSQADLEKFRRDTADADEFVDESRAAFRRTNGFKNL